MEMTALIAEMMKNDNDGSGDYGNDGDKKPSNNVPFEQ